MVDVAAAPGALGEGDASEDLQVVAHLGLGEASCFGELLDACLLVGSCTQRGEQAWACGVGEGLEPSGQVLPVLCGGSAVKEALVGRCRWRGWGGHRLFAACAEGAGIRGVGALGVGPAAGTDAAGRAGAGAMGCAGVMVRPSSQVSRAAVGMGRLRW